MSESSRPRTPARPLVELQGLDELWFQVGGTLCNLSCTHCFISCHPLNTSFGFLDLETVRRHLDASRELGVKEYYFTGGEPFLNREILPILEETLRHGPATVLTNGTAFTERTVRELSRIERASRYSLELRVSIDGHSPETNDPIRGEGSFAAAMEGVRSLVDAGFLPIITIACTWPDEESERVLGGFLEALAGIGYSRPRLKVMPALRIGEEARRSRPYGELERVSADMLEGYDRSQLLCSRGRTVTDKGIAVCPILLEAPDAILGESLEEASRRPFEVRHGACYTCYQHGAICSNAGSRGETASAPPGGTRG